MKTPLDIYLQRHSPLSPDLWLHYSRLSARYISRHVPSNAGRMRRRGTERMMTLHPYAPVPGTQLGWSVLSYARVLARVLACAKCAES